MALRLSGQDSFLMAARGLNKVFILPFRNTVG
ncbi:hypothetical protein SEEM1674_21534 [Salmonella enterica subsp. enterica serovar Muenchen str. baa1674]|nr:hypothetical protein SEEN447_12631 [Salmonella enterica subsp. enterica serovar Newport str. CVM 19447]EJA22287.1 hypothetical protein SEEN567_01642 [Salmonella enterica subsp. enterica serovar Newport str. CVM 19567]EJA28434.1 hypothetical protein SEEN449_02929 [Salmonella enterica subsp. enterica serovar Newport str. CVM 19449]ESG43272.1 hypothetical protein SEEM1674_21534 [Salmonella enterica subsp. enterica serovar Muenchen str. baa1674]